ncbi:hypothetical protein PIB30_031525 [Stylosanthes scabra]|uniref:Aminotransferase-like plant mobile domain-containing protein n=1 Tax=Stylosanthes scabra TaxID=79078 RepID=A0ABU6ZBI7_9FABA|nr:hypothetical protein [Stylosanthes scabra]
MLTDEEQLTWRAAVPIVCFMFLRMHHIDRVKRQLGGEQQIPEDPVNLDGLLTVSARGEDQHWPTYHAQWYDAWRGRFAPERQVTITPTQYPAMPTREYFEWWDVACRHRFLSPADALDDPRLDGLPDDVPAAATQQRDVLALPGDVPLVGRRRQRHRPDIKKRGRAGRGRGADGEPHRPVGAMDSEKEAEYDRQADGGGGTSGTVEAGTSGHGGEAGTSGHGGDAGTQHTYDTTGGPLILDDIPVDDAFFDGAEHDFQTSFGGPGTSASAEPRYTQQFMDPSMDFIATVSESQFGQVSKEERPCIGCLRLNNSKCERQNIIISILRHSDQQNPTKLTI